MTASCGRQAGSLELPGKCCPRPPPPPSFLETPPTERRDKRGEEDRTAINQGLNWGRERSKSKDNYDFAPSFSVAAEEKSLW